MDLSISEFVLSVVFGSSALVLIFTAISRTLHARSEARSLANRYICRLCLHAYEDHKHTTLTHCPRCGAANERNRNRRFC